MSVDDAVRSLTLCLVLHDDHSQAMGCAVLCQRRVRWCVSGRPRLSLSVEDKPQSTEVISTYTFDSKGKIYEHQVDQIIPPESMLVRLGLLHGAGGRGWAGSADGAI